MEVGILYLPSIGNKAEIMEGMAGRRTDLYQTMMDKDRTINICRRVTSPSGRGRPLRAG